MHLRSNDYARSLELGVRFNQKMRSGASLPATGAPVIYAGRPEDVLAGAGDINALTRAIQRRVSAGQYGEAARKAAQDTAQSPQRSAEHVEVSSGRIESRTDNPNCLMEAVLRRLKATGRTPVRS